MDKRPWIEKVEVINHFAYDCYLKFESYVRTKVVNGIDNDGCDYDMAMAQIKRLLFEQLIELGLFELIESYYLSDYGIYVETYVFRFGPDHKNVFAVDITDMPDQIQRSMMNYIDSIKADNLKRVSKKGNMYTITMFGILNSKLLLNRNGYAYCAATGSSFKEYRQFDRDLAKFGRYVKEKAEDMMNEDDGCYINDNLKTRCKGYGIHANQSIAYVIANFSDHDYQALHNQVKRVRGYRGYIDELRKAYIFRLTEPIIKYDNGAVNIDALQTQSSNEIDEIFLDEHHENIKKCLNWLDSLALKGKRHFVLPYLITTVLI